MARRLFALGLLAVLAAPALLGIQEAAAPKLTPEAIRQTVETAAKMIAENYVLADLGRDISALLLKNLKGGHYDAAADPSGLAALVTQDLLAAGNDLHLSLRVRSAGGFGPQPRAAAAPPAAGPVRPSLQPNGLGAHYNFGFLRLDRLAGNIGYLELALFNDPRSEAAQRVIEAAMNFLSGMDAVIIDLRYNGGGTGAMADLLASYFFGPEPVHLLSNTTRRGGKEMTLESWTLREIPGRRMPQKDLYLLVSNYTGSAAEHFAFGLKGQRRAVLVGEKTAGAGFNVAMLPIGEHFQLTVSIGRTFDPRTDQGWEKTGIAPDIEVPEEKALETAHILALRTLAGKIQDEGHKKEILWLADLTAKRADPVPYDQRKCESFAGTYGSFRILWESGRLYFARADSRVKFRLVPLAGTEYSIVADDTRILEFEPKIGTVELIMRFQDGRTTRIPMDPPASR